MRGGGWGYREGGWRKERGRGEGGGREGREVREDRERRGVWVNRDKVKEQDKRGTHYMYLSPIILLAAAVLHP